MTCALTRDKGSRPHRSEVDLFASGIGQIIRVLLVKHCSSEYLLVQRLLAPWISVGKVVTRTTLFSASVIESKLAMLA